MEISEKEVNGINVYTMDGRVDTDGAITLENTMEAALNAGKTQIVLDMASVRYINSAGLRVLAEVLTANQERGGNLFLVAVNTKVKRVFKIIGFDNFFQMFDTLDEALAAF